jgi:asparagine synthase (glutamine-hydrolysing)
MCRICGIVSHRLQPEQIREKVSLMCTALQHGGPDDEGIFTDIEKKLVFGHRRLSIIDLSRNGHQPMADVNQKAWITFNGEIYNYLQLKTELIKSGAAFSSDTDTEVIIQAYLHWGVKAFSKLRGMFAFALFDKEKALTYLVRDTAGIKPLYYHIEDGQLSFSSEVKALKIAGIVNEADKNWQIRFLAFGHIPEPYTTLKNVFSLAKGYFLCWDGNKNSYTINSYQAAAVDKNYITDKNEAIARIHYTLKASIDRQLIADAPIGVFLSGGIDSSLITLLANEQKKNQLKTISVFFDEKAYDESAYQKIIFDKIQGDKFTHLVKQQDFEDAFPQIIQAMDMPTNDGINTWFISKYAQKDGLKAVLSGLGADELYGGYPSFKRVKYLNYLRKLPSSLFSIAAPLAADQYKKIEYLTHNHVIADYLLLRGLFAPTDIAKILNVDVKEVNSILFSDTIAGTASYNKQYASWLETNLYMQNQLLRDTDVMSMSHGLEVRVPFLDEDFLSLTGMISPEIRFGENPAKKLLIDSFKDILPPAIWSRPKMGFTFPLQQWMQQYPAISDFTLYNNKTAQGVIKKFKNNSVHWSKSFALYQLQAYE